MTEGVRQPHSSRPAGTRGKRTAPGARLLVGVCLLSTPSLAAARSQNVTVRLPEISGPSWPAVLAQEGGYYEKYGMSVELAVGARPAGAGGIVDADAEVTLDTLEQSMIALMRDGSTVIVGATSTRTPMALMAQPDISSVAALRGHRIAVGRTGDARYRHTSGILEKLGMSARDVRWLAVGAVPDDAAAALAAGRVDAALVDAPAYYGIQERGFRPLANLTDYDDVYAPIVYRLSGPAAAASPGLAERVVQAHAEAVRRFYQDKTFAVDAYVNHDPETERAAVERMYDEYHAGDAFDRIPYVPAAAVRRVLDNAADGDLAEVFGGFDFGPRIDPGAIDRLLDAGFFESVFGSAILSEPEADRRRAFGR